MRIKLSVTFLAAALMLCSHSYGDVHEIFETKFRRSLESMETLDLAVIALAATQDPIDAVFDSIRIVHKYKPINSINLINSIHVYSTYLERLDVNLCGHLTRAERSSLREMEVDIDCNSAREVFEAYLSWVKQSLSDQGLSFLLADDFRDLVPDRHAVGSITPPAEGNLFFAQYSNIDLQTGPIETVTIAENPSNFQFKDEGKIFDICIHKEFLVTVSPNHELGTSDLPRLLGTKIVPESVTEKDGEFCYQLKEGIYVLTNIEQSDALKKSQKLFERFSEKDAHPAIVESRRLWKSTLSLSDNIQAQEDYWEERLFYVWTPDALYADFFSESSGSGGLDFFNAICDIKAGSCVHHNFALGLSVYLASKQTVPVRLVHAFRLDGGGSISSITHLGVQYLDKGVWHTAEATYADSGSVRSKIASVANRRTRSGNTESPFFYEAKRRAKEYHDKQENGYSKALSPIFWQCNSGNSNEIRMNSVWRFWTPEGPLSLEVIAKSFFYEDGRLMNVGAELEPTERQKRRIDFISDNYSYAFYHCDGITNCAEDYDVYWDGQDIFELKVIYNVDSKSYSNLELTSYQRDEKGNVPRRSLLEETTTEGFQFTVADKKYVCKTHDRSAN